MTEYYLKYNEIDDQFHVVDEHGYAMFNHKNPEKCLQGASEFLGVPKEDIR